LRAYDIAELRCDPASITLIEGKSQLLEFTGIATDGTEIPADNAVKVRPVPQGIGFYQDGRFIAGEAGSGYLDCEVNGVHAFIPVNVGGFGRALNLFGGESPISFSGFPSDKVTGEAVREDAGGRNITRLTYTFKQSYNTQAAYVLLDAPILLPGEPMALRMRVMGDGSGNWLRGRIKDANGDTYPIDFEYSIDFTGWQTVTAMLPANAVKPLTLDQIYVAALTCDEEQTNTLYFDMLEALYMPPIAAAVPEGQKYNDPMKADLSGAAGAEGVYDFFVPGAGAEYSARKLSNIALITMTASEGGIYATDANQWTRFTADISNIWPDFIVVMLNESPDNFKSQMEAELLHDAMAEQLKLYNRKVFVVSAAGTANVCTIKDGIRYVSLASPANGGSGRIRFRVDGKNIWFDANI
jgi:hypothetical protein